MKSIRKLKVFVKAYIDSKLQLLLQDQNCNIFYIHSYYLKISQSIFRLSTIKWKCCQNIILFKNNQKFHNFHKNLRVSFIISIDLYNILETVLIKLIDNNIL